MKPIEGVNLDIEVKMIDTGVGDLDVVVKMKPTEQKMKPTGIGNADV